MLAAAIVLVWWLVLVGTIGLIDLRARCVCDMCEEDRKNAR